MTDSDDSLRASRRSVLGFAAAAVAAGGAAISPTAAATAGVAAATAAPRSGPVGFTSFINPSASIGTLAFDIGAQSLIEGFVSLEGASAKVGHAANLQDNSRLLNVRGAVGDLEIGDGAFTAHNVTFAGRVRVGSATGTVISAVLQNATVGDASITGFTARVTGKNPRRPIEIPDATLVLFGARINDQDDVAANTIPIPAGFSLFGSDVQQENILLARAYNLAYRAAARITPSSDDPNSPRNPGADFPDEEAAFGTFTLGPPTVDRRGTGVLPVREASLNDLSFQVFEPAAPGTSPDPASPEAGARFIRPKVTNPDLVRGAILVGGVTLAANVRVGLGSYLHGGDAPAISVGENTTIGRNTSIHELTFTSVRIGKSVAIGDRVVLHGPLEIGDNVRIGDGSVLFGPKVAPGVKIGARVLAFGPIEITRDVPDDSIVVPAELAGLVAPSHKGPRATLEKSAAMRESWRFAQDHGAGCRCGFGLVLRNVA